jgi:hypothetical protein
MRKFVPLAVLCLSATALAAQAPAPQAPAPEPPAAPQAAPAEPQPETHQGAIVVEPQEPGSKVWLGRHAEFEEYLKTAPVAKVGDVPVGVTHPKRAYFAPGGLVGSAALKYLPSGIKDGFWESYKSEIAAYKMDRLLELDMVPPTIERRVGADKASLQLWVENCKLLKMVDQSQAPHQNAWAKQVLRQRVFDDLIANIDRNAGNLLIDDQWNLILIDHSRAFATDKMPFELTRIDREMFNRLKALDEKAVMTEIKPWVVAGGTVKEMMKRRDQIVARFEQLARERGEAAVFPF